LTAPYAGGFRIAKVWDDRDRKTAEVLAGIFDEPPKVCDSPEEASEGVDLVFVADCNGDGSDHVALATPALRNGIPLFLDKPFASTLADARRIMELSAETSTPVFSASILQYETQLLQFRSRLPETGGVHSGIVTGFTSHPAGLVHSVAAACTLFGGDIVRTRCLPAPGGPLFHLEYAEGRGPAAGVLIRCGEAPYRWTTMKASAYGRDGDIHGQILHDYYCQAGTVRIIELIREMVRTRRTPADQVKTLGIIAIMDAARRAEQSGRAEDVEETAT
jgi:predicted dehydrogenase